MALFMESKTSSEQEGAKSTPIDILLLLSMILLISFGILMVYSASRDLDGSRLMERQVVFAGIGLGLFLLLSWMDYREFRLFSPVVYAVTIFMLTIVFAQAKVAGTNRWLSLPGGFNLQPSEFAKLSVILLLAAVLAGTFDDEDLTWRRLGAALLMLALPGALIVLQPDLGTALAFGFVTIVVLFAAGATIWQLSGLFSLAGLGVWIIFKYELLLDYQLARLTSFLDPAADKLGSGYNVLNSLTTIGSGQLFGRGLFNGALTERSFVPEQETDFIFTAVGEQLGFIGGALVLFAYALIILRLLRIATAASDRFGSLIAVGVAGLFVFHVIVNVGMTLAVMPVTGLPLPFMSAGGSSMLAMCMALGVAHSVWRHRDLKPARSKS
ncbi:MAG: rod shape-determining protein RodA [Acidimicrobiia bacterium]|nr:rod shape-determining protein RodA [Acidimicrobiia bacterium]